jgi:lysyl-tRNA synthetase class II
VQSILNKNIDNYPNINWMLIALAQHYYESLGYQYVETPWMVPTSYTEKTKPFMDKSFVMDSDLFENQNQELVGSAEQGFLYLIDNGKLQPGKYCSISPCFRTESYDSLHQPWFLKLELIDFGNVNQNSLNDMLEQAFKFFRKNTEGALEIVSLPDKSYDINLNGIEIGSYGIRNINGIDYIYGTGLALPRFSVAGK